MHRPPAGLSGLRGETLAGDAIHAISRSLDLLACRMRPVSATYSAVTHITSCGPSPQRYGFSIDPDSRGIQESVRSAFAVSVPTAWGRESLLRGQHATSRSSTMTILMTKGDIDPQIGMRGEQLHTTSRGSVLR